MVCASLKFRSWIGSSQVQVKAYVDHKSLESWYKEDLSTFSGPLGRRGRWHEFLSSFDIEVIYLPGPENVVADALSRWPYPAGLDQDCTFHGSLADERYHEEQEQRDRDYCEGHQGISSVRADNPSSSGAENYVYACCLHQEIDKKLQAIHRVSCRERDFSVACEVAGLESSASSDLNADEIQLFEPYSNPNPPLQNIISQFEGLDRNVTPPPPPLTSKIFRSLLVQQPAQSQKICTRCCGRVG